MCAAVQVPASVDGGRLCWLSCCYSHCRVAAALLAFVSTAPPCRLLLHPLPCREMAVALHPDKCRQPQAKEAFQVGGKRPACVAAIRAWVRPHPVQTSSQAAGGRWACSSVAC